MEEVILEKIRNEDTRNYGFNLLVREYQERVYWHIRKMVVDHDDADDLVQEVFVKVWKNLASFREDAKLFTWIYRIATNECLTFLRRKKRKFFIPINDVAYELGEKMESDPALSGDQIQLKLQKA